MKKYQNMLNEIEREYEDEIIRIAKLAQKEYINPYLKKNNFHMLVGNGTYYIFNPKDTNKYIHFDFPKRIYQILSIPVNTIHNMELGCWMNDYIGDN